MFYYGVNPLLLWVVFMTFIDLSLTAKLKDSLFPKHDVQRQKRDIDGNNLPPMPLTSQTTENGIPVEFRNGGVSQQDSQRPDQDISGGHQTSDGSTESPNPGMVNVGSDPEMEFSSRIGAPEENVRQTQTQSSHDSSSSGTGTGTGSGYRYTSTVYSGPDAQPDYRYRPPYDQLGQQTAGTNQQNSNSRQQEAGSQNTGNRQTAYSPFVGHGVNYNNGGSRRQYVGDRSRYPINNRNERVYGGRSNYIPNRGVMSNEPTCPVEQTQILINNMGCTEAINNLGTFICYNYERVSKECCERCLTHKTSNVGCEYGDWSYQCRNIQPFDCYNQRNREICCETCQFHKDRQAVVIPGCEYGDLTPRCQIIRERRHLCYLPENKRLCCVTCPSLADEERSVCQWGDQNPDLCRPYNQRNQLRINCYTPTVQQICCETCERLKSRTRDQIAGCEYGDRPVSFSTPFGVIDCANYIRRFGVEVCSNADVSMHCCYTCYRYRLQLQQGKK